MCEPTRCGGTSWPALAPLPPFCRAPWKGRVVQWEEGIPPGNGRSSRKQPERLGPATARVEASGEKGPFEGISERAGYNE